ncbi:MAG: RluA family pseudouridine synthase [Holosporaceae bacterium]|nr:RluA family pseudouridine synthase [Holosporaceae bacterium]
MEYIVTIEENDSRADRVIRNICRGFSYVFLQKIFRTHRVTINGKKVKASDRVRTGDVIKIFAPFISGTRGGNGVGTTVTSDFGARTVPGAIATKSKENSKSFFHHPSQEQLLASLREMIIFENDDMLAINKPNHLAVQMGTGVSICVETFINTHGDGQCRLVHRLDRETSGVLLVAKTQPMARRLTQLFRENKIHKTYLAVLEGVIKKSGIIDNFLEKSFLGNEERMRIATPRQNPGARRAITHYYPLQTAGKYTLAELKPLTGRKHQLRLHCAGVLHAPILGDAKYGKMATKKRSVAAAAAMITNERVPEAASAASMDFPKGFLFLHAHEIFLEEWNIKITAPLPQHMLQAITFFGKR